MAYCLIEDIQRILPTTVGSPSSKKTYPSAIKLKEADYLKIIDEVSNQMDQRFVRVGWPTPIDTTRSTRVKSELSRICTLGSAATILRRENPGDDGALAQADSWESQYYGDIKFLIANGLGPEYPELKPTNRIIIRSSPALLNANGINFNNFNIL